MVTLPTKSHRRRLMTAAEYLALPGDGNRYELVAGELQMSPSHFHEHGCVQLFVAAKLQEFASRHRIGVVGIETDCILADRDVRRPDVHYIASRRLSIIRGHVHGAPDLAVEVTSPSNWQEDVYTKRDDYERFGVREYWVFDIAEGRRRAFAWSLRRGLYHGGLVETATLRSHLLKGFSLRLDHVWKRISPGA